MTGSDRAPGRLRLDVAVVERGLAPTRSRAAALIVAGRVLVNDQRVDKPGTQIKADAELRVKGEEHGFVSRGGVKLRGALDAFRLDVTDRVAIDVGASTGGFTDCLLQAGVTRVHAVDVGYGQLAWSLAQDPRVVSHERTNIRGLGLDVLGERCDLAVADCSFIALAKVVPHIAPLLCAGAHAVLLVKPQFELEPEHIGKGGLVKDPQLHALAVQRARAACEAAGFEVLGQCDSPITGQTGNREFFVHLRLRDAPA